MNDRDWSSMSEKEFDTLLEGSVAETPPEDIVAEITPWKKAANRVLAAGKLRREILRPVVQTDKVDDLRSVHRVFAYLCGKLNVFNGREVLNKVIKLEHKAHIITAIGRKLVCVIRGYFFPVEHNAAGCKAVHTAENIQKRGFSCTGCADNNAYFALFDLKGRILECFDAHLAHVICLFNFFKFNVRHSLPALNIFIRYIILNVYTLCNKKPWSPTVF